MKENCSSVDWLFPLIIVLHRPHRHYGNRRLYLNFKTECIVEPRYNEGLTAGLAKYVRNNEVSFYGGSFPYILLLLGELIRGFTF